MKVFTEEQRFNQWWIYATLILAFIGALIPFILEKNKLNNGDKESVTALVIIIVTMGLIFILIRTVKLTTKINEIGIHYRFSPIQRNDKTIKWGEIKMCKVIKYNPIKDYGGYGWRIGFRGKGKALNIRGNKGIQIIYKNNKKLLIGTQKPELADKTITTYFNPITTT